MTNLEAKQEAIKKAYSEYYIHADKNGWIRYLIYCPSDLGIENYDDMDGFWRCKSLQGIENNNGWIRIESEDDLPKESFNYWIFQSDLRAVTMKDFYYNKKYYGVKATHYRPIVKPLKPLY